MGGWRVDSYRRCASGYDVLTGEVLMTEESEARDYAILSNLHSLRMNPDLPIEQRLAVSYLMGSFAACQAENMEQLAIVAEAVNKAIYTMTVEAMRLNTCPCEKCQADKNRKYH
jgi:hypothetical protein